MQEKGTSKADPTDNGTSQDTGMRNHVGKHILLAMRNLTVDDDPCGFCGIRKQQYHCM
jgi:hypothetical protein